MGNGKMGVATPRSARAAERHFRPARGVLALLLTGVSVAALSALPAQAWAADTVAATVEEIVVTANKREETANSVPMSITAASGEVLARQGIKQVRDLVRITPSFTYTDSYVGSPIYTLRGVGFSDISLGGRSTVGVYLDEAPIPFPIETRGASLDLERVEVLKGPQGTLFGQNATGGAINYIAAKPTESFEAGVHLGYANYDAIEAGGFVSGPLGGALSARLAVEHTQSDGWQQSYTTGVKNGAGDFTNGRLILDWAPDGPLKAQLTLNGFLDRSEVQAGQVTAISPGIPAAAAFVPGLLTYPLSPNTNTAADFNPGQDYRRDNDFAQANLRIDYDLTDALTLTSISSLSRYNQDQLQDIDGTSLSNLSQLTHGRISSASEELRIAGPVGERGNFVFGLNYAWDEVLESNFDDISQSTIAFTFTPFGLPLFTSFRHTNNQVTKTVAAFVSGDYALGDDVTIYGGARFTRAIDKFNGCSADSGDGIAALDFGVLQNVFRGGVGLPPNAPIAAGGCVTADAAFVPGLVRSTLDEDNLAWRAGAEWTPAARTLIYANVSKGFKAGGFPSLGATLASQYEPAAQESVVAYELGFKTTLRERTLQLNGATFYYDYSDKQILGKVLDPIFGPLLRLINVPKSEIVGAELQAVWVPVQGLTVTAGGSYIKSKILDHFSNYDAAGALRDFHGEAFPNTPKWQFVSDVDYRFDLTDGLGGFVGGGLSYQSATNSQLGELPDLKVKAYALLDLRAGVETRDGAWRVTVWGRNVGDTTYWTAVNRNLDTTVRFAGMPATYGVTLAHKFR